MSYFRTLLIAALVGLACSLVAGHASAEKKGPKQKTTSRFFGDTSPLKMADDKLKHAAELDDEAPRFQGQHSFKVYTVQLEKDKTYRIDLKNTGDDAKFDLYLVLEDETGKELDADDDSGGG